MGKILLGLQIIAMLGTAYIVYDENRSMRRIKRLIKDLKKFNEENA